MKEDLIIYRVAHNYHNGAKEFKIFSINNDGTFTYIDPTSKGRFIIKSFIPKGNNGASFFLTKEEATKFLIKRITKKILRYEKQVKILASL